MAKYPDRHLEVTFHHETFQFYPGQATPAFSRECRRVTGMGAAELWRTFMADQYFEADVAALLLWAARTQTAVRLGISELALPLDAIEASLTYDDVLDFFTADLKGIMDEPEVDAEMVEGTPLESDKALEVPADPEG